MPADTQGEIRRSSDLRTSRLPLPGSRRSRDRILVVCHLRSGRTHQATPKRRPSEAQAKLYPKSLDRSLPL